MGRIEIRLTDTVWLVDLHIRDLGFQADSLDIWRLISPLNQLMPEPDNIYFWGLDIVGLSQILYVGSVHSAVKHLK